MQSIFPTIRGSDAKIAPGPKIYSAVKLEQQRDYHCLHNGIQILMRTRLLPGSKDVLHNSNFPGTVGSGTYLIHRQGIYFNRQITRRRLNSADSSNATGKAVCSTEFITKHSQGRYRGKRQFGISNTIQLIVSNCPVWLGDHCPQDHQLHLRL